RRGASARAADPVGQLLHAWSDHGLCGARAARGRRDGVGAASSVRSGAAAAAVRSARLDPAPGGVAAGIGGVMSLLETIWDHTQRAPACVAIERLAEAGAAERVEYGALAAAVAAVALEVEAAFEARGRTKVALVAANSPEWIAADLALQLGGFTEI